MTKMAVLKLRKERKDKGIKRMKKLNYCKTCKFRNEYDNCENQKITDNYYDPSAAPTDDMLVYSYAEGGTFHAADKFGCVHHAEKEV